MADMKTFRLLVNTPDRVFYNDDVTMVELSTTEGDSSYISTGTVCYEYSCRWRCKKSCCARRNC